jgi:hypothetical protein
VASSSSEAFALGRPVRSETLKVSRNTRARVRAHHGLKVDKGLKAALRDLGLVGRVLRVPRRIRAIGGRQIPARILEQRSLDHGWQDIPVVSLANV